MTCKLEVLGLFETYIGYELDGFSKLTQGLMDRKQFTSFLLIHQKADSLSDAEATTDKIFTGRSERISFYNFCMYLLSEDNSIVSSKLQQTEFS